MRHFSKHIRDELFCFQIIRGRDHDVRVQIFHGREPSSLIMPFRDYIFLSNEELR